MRVARICANAARLFGVASQPIRWTTTALPSHIADRAPSIHAKQQARQLPLTEFVSEADIASGVLVADLPADG